MNEIWILGAAGRVGAATAQKLATHGFQLVLVGRDASKLDSLARTLPGSPQVVAASFDDSLAQLSKSSASVVVNTVGPFARTMKPVVHAMPNGAHYADVTNELTSVLQLQDLDTEARAAGKCVIAGAGYGFVSTQSVVMKLCEGRPAPARVRVDAIPFITGPAAIIGEALASSIIDSVAGGGFVIENGQPVRAAVGSHAEKTTLPDGRQVTLAGGAPTGDLEGARRISGASSVVAGSSELPSGVAMRMLLPMFSALLSWAPARNFAVRRLAAMKTPPSKKTEGHSWGHARVEWSDGTTREGWLKTGDGMTFTAAVLAETATRLAKEKPNPGAFTPCEVFGSALAEAAGATFI